MTTLWFFKRCKINPDYIVCSDRTCYSTKRKQTVKVAPWPGRQKYLRFAFWNKGKRVLRSVESIFAMHFRPALKPVTTDIECPF